MQTKITLSLVLTALSYTSMLQAAESVALDTVVVDESAESNMEATVAPDTLAGVQSYSEAGIKTFSAQANTSALKGINMSPSVSFNSVDAFGSNESSFHDPMRIRGKNQSGPGGVLTVEGLPLNSNPGGGKTIYDMENFAYVDLYKGYMPVDKSLGFSNLIGKVDLIIDRPKNSFAVQLSQMAGSDNAARTFMRVDTGKMGDVSAFGSFSYTQGDKWKGDGDLERYNGMLGFAYTPNDRFKSELYVIMNKDTHNNYYQMTYEEASDLDTYYDKDYGKDATKAAYADYNKQKFEDTAVMANIEYAFAEGSKVSFKPYYLHDKGEYWFDTAPSNPANTAVKHWQIDHDLFGGVAQYEQKILEALRLKLGYWMHWQQPPGPPTDQELYDVSSGTPVYTKTAIQAETDYHEFNSPFIEFSGENSGFSYVAGLRYLNFRLAGIDNYKNGSIDPLSSVDAKIYREWLPSLYLAYAPQENLHFYTDYTRSYGYDVNLFPFYVSNQKQGQNFAAKGISLQQLWDKQQPELSDNFDLGMTYNTGGITLNPNLFFTRVTGKQASLYDAEYDVVYPTNNADAMSYGFELTASGAATSYLDFMVSGSYNRYYYTEDLQTGATKTASIKGNQIPDAPKYMANAAVTYHEGGWQLTPSLRYYSERYGDVDNTQKISGATLVDIDGSYTYKKLWAFKEATFRVTMTNLFNRQYISSIITPDNALAANTTKTSYQAGAPFGVYAGIALKF
ncbi:TonB-dependent receptor [Sulfurimonas sp. HSL3-7]|uniref:TonB-dependent receptor n=1 Tax=Sulfonitrofixus jiaomeiensis TaxID=3131938 RepID=UPI0031F7768F